MAFKTPARYNRKIRALDGHPGKYAAASYIDRVRPVGIEAFRHSEFRT